MQDKKAETERKARKRHDTRDRLLDAAYALVTEAGLEQTTLTRIGERAELSRRVMYIHFRDKEACIIAAAARAFSGYAASVELATPSGKDPAVIMAQSVFNVFGPLSDDPIVPQLMSYPEILALALEESVAHFVIEDVKVGIETGRLSAPANNELPANLLRWSMMCLTQDCHTAGTDKKNVLLAYAQTWLRMLGLSPDEALSISELVSRS